MDFIDEENLSEKLSGQCRSGCMYAAHASDYFGLAFFSPLGHFRVDLVAEFGLNLPRVSCEESEEALCPAIDNVYLM